MAVLIWQAERPSLVLDPAGSQLYAELGDAWRVQAEWVDVLPIPDKDLSFERVWAESSTDRREDRK